MFFPDTIRANAEARRVLRAGGQYILVTFDRLHLNPIPEAVGKPVASLFRNNPLYMERGPFSYTDRTAVTNDLRAAGFKDVRVETIQLASTLLRNERRRKSCSAHRSAVRSSGWIRLRLNGRRQSSRSAASVGRQGCHDVCAHSDGDSLTRPASDLPERWLKSANG